MTDKMTREEAIQLLHDMKDTYDEIHENTNGDIGYEQMTALDMAIEALQTDAVDVYKAHEEEHLNIINRIKELQYAILGEKHQRSHGRLIDADELKKHLDGAWEELNDDGERKGVRLARWYLISAPTVDSTIDVVRCKDCIWGKEWNDKQIFCDRILMRLRENDFCSYGERKQDD